MLNNLSIKRKMIYWNIFILILFIITLVYIGNDSINRLMDEKRTQIRNLSDALAAVIFQYIKLEKEGKLSEIIRKLCLLPKANPKKNVPELILLDFINEEYALGPALNINDSTDFTSFSTSRVREFAETYRKYNVEMNAFAKLAGQE